MKVDIDKIAQLANLPLTPEEKELFSPQLEQILTFVQKLDNLNTDGVEPTYQVTGQVNRVREDCVTESLDAQAARQNAPQLVDGYIVTKGVFDEK